MELKYVRHSRVGFVLWPKTDALYHAHVGRLMSAVTRGEVLSAGFARVGGGLVSCYGMSESLGIRSAKGDSEALAKQLDLTEFDSSQEG